MDDTRIENMMRFGHQDRKAMIAERKREEAYVEDIYGDEIKLGDIYFETENGNVHGKNASQYLRDLGFSQKERS